ncbi:MAG: urea ABC transporter permease subunit UrtB [Phormidium sp. BM_Day4_Bin.17]|nr:urea ABC transporter permease subunit UrtB [Phormidium sp. BM_Day4_Bin.17]UCJ12506.1 MAG: urea ABC transporter permease subunit UrtB [Phormidium sp. PBR-2020]
MIELAVGIFNGIGIGSVLLIAALGLAIVFGLMGVINLAHGELMMLGAYATFVVQNFFRDLDAGDGVFGLYIIVALPVAFLVSAVAGLILERGVIRFLYGRPLETLLATWGVSLILRQLVRSVNWLLTIAILLFCALFFGGMWLLRRRPNWEGMKGWAIAILLPLSLAIAGIAGWAMTGNATLARPWFGPRNLDVSTPPWLRGGFELGAYRLPYSRMFIIVLTILCLAGIYWFFNRSDWGLRIRSVTQNRDMSACLGIPTGTVDALTFALGSGLAGIAGCAITLLGSVGPNVGQNYIVDTFMVVVVGGVGNLFGAIIAALTIGVSTYLLGSGALARVFEDINSLQFVAEFLRFFTSTSMARVMVFVLIIAFLQVKPSGIFPQKGRTAEL